MRSSLLLVLWLTLSKALIIAVNENELYNSILNSVTAILFLGTPHRGSEETSIPLILTSIVNVALTGTSRVVGSMRSDLIKAIEKDSPVLKDISTNFRHLTRNIKVASFIEQDITPPSKKRVLNFLSHCILNPRSWLTASRSLIDSLVSWILRVSESCLCQTAITGVSVDSMPRLAPVTKLFGGCFRIGPSQAKWVSHLAERHCTKI